MTNSDLKARAQTIQALIQQRDDITAEIKACYDSAASAGFNKSAMKKAIKLASMSQDKRAKHDQEAQEIQLYLFEIEGGALSLAADDSIQAEDDADRRFGRAAA